MEERCKMWKKNVLIRGIFCMMHSFRVFFQKLKILVFIKNAAQVAILKKEHCKFCIWLLIRTFTIPCGLYISNI